MGDRREAFAARRALMGFTQETFADVLGVDFSTVGRWERGDLTPQPWRRPRIAKILDLTLAELDTLLLPPRRSSAPPATATTAVDDHVGGRTSPYTARPAPPDPAETDDMNRRELLRLFSMTGTVLALSPIESTLDVERLALASRSDGVEASTVMEFEQFNSHLWQVYAHAPTKSQVLPLVRNQLDVLSESLRLALPPSIREGLCRLSADLFQLAGEISFDGDRYTDAAHCYTLAATAAKEGNAFDLWACALTRHAFISVYERRFDNAAPMLDLATELARRGDPALSTRHWVAAVQAETFAGLGAFDACQRALDAAAEVQHLQGAVHNGGWLRFDGSRLAEERGTCYVTLGRLDLAEAALTDALSGNLTARRKASVLTDLAMIGVERRDPDQVTAYADAVLATARRTASGVVVRKLRGLQPHLAPLLAHEQIQRLDADISTLVGSHAA